MDFTNQEQVLGAVRWLITLAGSWAVQRGYVDDDMVTLIVGAVAAVASLAWSIVAKTKAAQAKQVASIPGVQVVVSPSAPASLKALAADPGAPSVVPSRPGGGI